MKRWASFLLFAVWCGVWGLPHAAQAAFRFPWPAGGQGPSRSFGVEMSAPSPLPPPPGRETLIVQGETDLFHPSVAAGGMLVWYARGEEGMDVFGLRLGDDGYTPGEVLLIAGGPGDQSLPFVASDDRHGGYLVVWHSHQGGEADVYARYLDASGWPQGEPWAVSVAQGDQLRPTAAYVPAADAFLVVWQDGRLGAVPDVYARLVPSFSTSRLGGGSRAPGREIAVSTSEGGQYIPTAACERMRARCLVVWQDDRHAEELFTDVVGRLVDADGGTAIGEEIEVAVASDYQYSPVAVFNPVSSEYLVVWDDDISARRISLAGRPIGSKIRVSLESPYQYRPAVAVTEEGTYLIVWEDLRNLHSRGADIYGQWLSSDGRPLGANWALSLDAHSQYSPAVVAGQEGQPGDFYVVWEDNRAGEATLALYGLWLWLPAYSPEGE